MGDYLTDYRPRTNNVKVELSLSNYATKEDLKNIKHGNYFKQTKVDYTRGKIINVYIVYALTLRKIDDYDDGENFVQVNGLFGNLNLSTTLDDTLKYRHHDGIVTVITLIYF